MTTWGRARLGLAAWLAGAAVGDAGCAPGGARDESTGDASVLASQEGHAEDGTGSGPSAAADAAFEVSAVVPLAEAGGSAALDDAEVLRMADGASPSFFDAAQATDGAAVDANASLAGPDAPADAAVMPGDEATAGCPGLFCEDFEKGTLDPAVWNATASGGQTVSVQTGVVAHGKYAVAFHANPNIESYDFIITKNAPAQLAGHHYGRAYFNVTPQPPAEHTEFLFAGTAGFPDLKYLEVASLGAAWQLTYVDLIGGTGESYASGGTHPDAKWFCLEWEFNDTPDQATVWVDGVESFARSTIAFDGESSGLVGGFADFGFGYYAWHPATYPFDVYYDDIVLDTQRVGCLAGP